MPDTTNLLDRTPAEWEDAWIDATDYRNTAREVARFIADQVPEIVRQAREGMVPSERLFLTDQRCHTLESENARLRAELETVKEVRGVRYVYRCPICGSYWVGETPEAVAGHCPNCPAPAVADTPTPDVRTQRQDLHDELDRTFPVCADFERFVRSAVADTGKRAAVLKWKEDGRGGWVLHDQAGRIVGYASNHDQSALGGLWGKEGAAYISLEAAKSAVERDARRIVAMGGGK